MDGSTAFLTVATGVLLAVVWWPERGVYFRWRHHRWVHSREAVEDALMYLYQQQHEGRAATIQSLAGALKVSTKRTLALIRPMAARDLLTFTGQGVRLSPEGHRLALQVVRVHRLVERYLADETSIPLGDIHQQAHHLEHRISPQELDRLDAHMGYPPFDPHGDPIPNAAYDVEAMECFPLVEWPIDRPAEIIHVEDEPPVVYAQVAAEGLAPGMVVTVLESSPQRLILESDTREHILAPVVAASIAVRAVPDGMRSQAGDRLTSLELGDQGRVVGLDSTCQGLTRRRLLDLGITAGALIEPILQSPFGEPTAYRVRDTLIALRREQADQILIAPRG